jgi:uncharacterized protein (DUF302 family)
MKLGPPKAQKRRQRSAKPPVRPQPGARQYFARVVRLANTDGAAALARAKSAFGQEGFGVVAEIDFRDTLQTRLDKDIGPFWLIEVCKPNLADRALAVDRKAGLLMPCKLAVWQEGRDAVVAALRPEVAVSLTGSEALGEIAREAEQHIERALVRLEAPGREPPPIDEA